MPPHPRLLFGPMLIGTYINAILYGVMVVQMFVYFQTYKKDPSWMRLFVVFLFVAETLNTGFDIGMMLEPLALKYGTPDAMRYFPMMLATDPLMTVIISTPIQIFIAYRIRVISQTRLFATLICVLAVISMGGGIWLTVSVIKIRQFARKPELHWPALTWLLSSAIADVTVTFSLIYHLARRKSGFAGTDDAINRIIRLTIQTGFVTAIFAILDVVCFLVLPHTTINFVWDFALSKLYTNAFISTLNARGNWGNLIGSSDVPITVQFGDDSRTLEFQGYPYPRRMGSTGLYELESISSQAPASGKEKPDTSLEFGVPITKQ